MQTADGLQRLEFVFSYRRRKETIGELDLRALCKVPAKLMNRLSTSEAIVKIEERGATRMTVHLKNRFQADLQITPPAPFQSL
jgi:DNA polymerase (family 10)